MNSWYNSGFPVRMMSWVDAHHDLISRTLLVSVEPARLIGSEDVIRVGRATGLPESQLLVYSR